MTRRTFRFPSILHGGDYNPEQWLGHPEVLAEDRRLRKLSGCNAFSVGIFSWSHLEPEEGHYQFDWLDRVLDDLASDHCLAILATPSAARPPWLAKRYPEVMRVSRDRRRELYTSRHNFCWSSPIYREKVEAICSLLAERYHSHPALGLWHISNELGGTEGNGECFCDLCLARWRDWLRDRYQTIEDLNAAWWSGFWSHRFNDWDEINPSDPTLDACALDWSRFVNFLMKDWIIFEAGLLRAHTPRVPITTNFMGVHPWIDYAELSQVVDIVSDDQYPAPFVGRENLEGAFLACAFKHDLQRCYKPGQPFLLMESCPETPQWHKPQALKHEHVHRAEMLQAIAHGAEGTCYFQWRKGRGGLEKLHGAVVDHVGSEKTRTFQIVQRLSTTYAQLGSVIGSRRTGEVALLYDHDSRRAIALTNGSPQAGEGSVFAAQEHYRPYWRRGVAVNVFDSRSTDWESSRLVILPHLFLLHPGVSERLAAYVERGGTLVATCLTGWVDENGKCLTGGLPGESLRKVFGLWLEELDELPKDVSLPVIPNPQAPGENWPDGATTGLAGVIHPEGAEVLARFGDGQLIPCGQPAILRHRYGKGSAWFFAGEFDRALLTAVHGSLINQLQIPCPFPHPLPDGILFASRAKPEAEFWFFSNLNPHAVTISLPPGLSFKFLTGDPTGTTDRHIQLPAQSDAILAVDKT
jgi:beta-galactosidase